MATTGTSTTMLSSTRTIVTTTLHKDGSGSVEIRRRVKRRGKWVMKRIGGFIWGIERGKHADQMLHYHYIMGFAGAPVGEAGMEKRSRFEDDGT